jgi:Ca2+-binding EF-hand superfamily protein
LGIGNHLLFTSLSVYSTPQFGSRQQSFKQSRFLRGGSNNNNNSNNNIDKLSRPKQNNNVVPRRLSPLKENSPSKPTPISTEFLPNQSNQNFRPSSSMNNSKRTNRNINQHSNTIGAVQRQQQSSYSSPTGFSQMELQELHESFQLFDIDNTGSISVGDLRSILKTLQSEQMQQQQTSSLCYPHLEKLLLRMADWGDEEELTLEDYMNLVASTTISGAMMQRDEYNGEENGDHHNYAHVFQLFDLEGKGYIELQDLERVALELGEHDITREELQEMIERAISTPSGKLQQQQQPRVSLNEFTRIMTMNLFSPKRDDQQEQQQQQQSNH